MNIASILTRKDPLKKALVTLEDGMADALHEEFLLPVEAQSAPNESENLETVDDSAEAAEQAPVAEQLAEQQEPQEQPEVEQSTRLTAHTQARLARYAAYDEARIRAQENFNRVADALAGILASHHIGREFLDDCYADIHRANEFENANAAFVAENRRLAERVDKLERLRARYDQLVEVMKRREAKLLDETETMRETVAALRLELVEARNAIAQGESRHGELQTVHAARSSEAERFMREAEILREKNVSLSVEFDLVQKKQAESRRRAEELSAMHSSDSARLAEMMARLVAQEAERTRLQKLNDALEMKLIETGEAATRVASELMERDKRHQSENQALRGEIQALHSRLQNAANEQREAETGLTEMRSRMDELESERHVLERKLAMLAPEGEDEGLAQALLVAPEAGEPSELDEHRQQTEQMQEQIAELQATVERLKQYERLYAAAKSRGKGKSEVASGFTVEDGQIVPEFANEKQAARA